MYTNHRKEMLTISILVLLSFACSYFPLSLGKPTPPSEPASATPEATSVPLATSLPTLTIPFFEPTATAAVTPIETAAIASPTKKVKTPAGAQTADPNQVCPNAQPTRLKLNGFAYLSYDPFLPNRIRIGPGVNYDAKGLIQPGEVMQLVSGPICSGESVWWKIVVKFTDENGWIAEADSQQYWLEPCPAEGHCPPLAP